MPTFTESALEEAALAWLSNLGYTVLHGADITPGTRSAERTDYCQVLLPKLISRQLRVPDAEWFI